MRRAHSKTPNRARKSQPSKPARPSRLLPILIALIAVAALAAGGWWWWQASRPGAIVLISIDTLRADHLPIYGYTKGQTPNIDAFAKDAVVVDRAYAHAPQTLPSHSSILTGLLPFEHGVRDNLGFTLKAGTPTLASMLKGAGYRTGGFVSAYVLRPETGISQGFDVYDAKFQASSQELSVAQVQRPGTETLAAAERWLGTQPNDRFFLFFHIYEPHTPYTPPARFAALAPYDGEVAFADEIVGNLFADLKKRGWYDRATIVLISDHGEGLGDHGEDEHGLFLYESTTRVPFLVKLPGNRDGGSRVPGPVQHIDIVPTLTAIAGAKAPSGLRGRDLLPVLEGQQPLPAQGIYAEALYARYHFGWSELLSLTDDRYSFIKAPKSELYDLQRDSGETDNLLGARPQVASAMRSGLDALIAGHGLDAPGAVSAEDRERLAALGYVSGNSTSDLTAPSTSLPDPKDKREVIRQYRSAVDAASTGQLDRSAALLAQLLASEPGMIDAWSQYGELLARLGRTEDALKAFQEIIKREPNEPIPFINAATMLMKLGRYKEAREHALAAVPMMPAGAHQLLATIAMAAGDHATALKEAGLAEQADPALPMSDYIQGLIAYDDAQAADKRGDAAGGRAKYDTALQHFVDASDRLSGRTMQIEDLRYYVGDCLARLDRYQEAEPYFKQEIAIYPGSLRARSGLAMLYAAESNVDAVDQTIDAMMRDVPTPQSYSVAAELWRRFGQNARAAQIDAARVAKFGR